MYLQHHKDKNADYEKCLTVADLEEATVTIVKLVQREVYAEEIKDLETGGNVKHSSMTVKLQSILDDSVIELGAALQKPLLHLMPSTL